MTPQEIDVALERIADSSVIDKFWISDEYEPIEFTNVPGLSFVLPTNHNSDTPAAPFANLLTGAEILVVQEAQPGMPTAPCFSTPESPGYSSPASRRCASTAVSVKRWRLAIGESYTINRAIKCC